METLKRPARLHPHGSRSGALKRWPLRSRRAPGLMLVPYTGYANRTRLIIRGRVIRERKTTPAEPHVPGWRNFIALARLMRSAKVEGAQVCLCFDSREYLTVTDKEGYFEFNVALARSLDGDAEIELRLVSPRLPHAPPIVSRATICVPPEGARFGVISDIDDTIVWTHVGNRRRMLWTLARSNASTRKPLAGVAALYRALRDGGGGNEGNPIFYVSSSPWNLYAPLVDFLRINGVPHGPMFLRDWGRHTLAEWRDHGTHKLAAIREIMGAYPHLPFILIGDSGEQDPEIYREVVREAGDRILAIYIRTVSASPARHRAIARIADEVQASGSELLQVSDSETAASREAQAGRIRQSRIDEVRLDRDVDQRSPLPGASSPL
jgi:phosphatidate phosphatase APP1